MWNHAQNCPPGDEENNDNDPNSGLKDRIEKSLDLTNYLKYLDQLFSQATSESDSSDSEDDERTRTFTDFVQPSAQPCSERSSSSLLQPPYNQNHIIIGSSISSSSITDGNHFVGLRSSDNFHLESNISSSSLSSIDSGTSSLSLNLSTEAFVETTLAKAEEAVSAIPLQENNSGGSPSICTESSNSSVPGTEDDKLGEEGGSDKKKTQKKKKTSKGNSASLPRQNKPSSGGKGNNGSKGGGGGSGSGTSNGNNDGSSGSSDNSGGSNQNMSSGGGGSPGAKTRMGGDPSQLSQDLNLHQSITDSQLCTDSLLLDGDLTDNFPNGLLGSTNDEGLESLESHGLNSFPLTALLDIQENETSLSDYISMSTPVSVPISSSSGFSSPMSQSSTNFFSKIAAAAATTTFPNSSRNNNSNVTIGSQAKKDGSKADNSKQKRKLEDGLVRPGGEKVAKLTEKQKIQRINVLNAKRRKIYVSICRKEIAKTQRNRTNLLKEGLANNRKLAQACARHVRKQAVQSEKFMKESVCKAKRLTQEMEAYWKATERAERDLIRKKEKEAELQYKQDMEILNKRQKYRKLNRIVTQAELFSSKLLKHLLNDSEILQSLDEIKDERIAHLDTYNSESLKTHMQMNTDRAVRDHQNLVKLLDVSGLFSEDNGPETTRFSFNEMSQPQMFEDVLTKSQICGKNWLIKSYIQGLNTILAENEERNNTAEVLACMSHLTEACGLWGPFLIVAPMSSLQKWLMDFRKMCPKFKVIPYWGKPMERNKLRQCWETCNLHTELAKFHIVLTSYQVMASDLKYISQIKWQYLIMDDAQGALTSSTKWMPLLSFRSRSKLLLSPCLRLNSLSHLCTYLYFVMPSLFDSEEEFSEWLLKELECPTVESRKSVIYEGLIERLQSVLQNFLLDHKKRQQESSKIPNIDIQLYCSPTTRQHQVYSDLLENSDLPGVTFKLECCRLDEVRNRIKVVLRLTTLLKEICNHPSLVEERNMVSPFWMKSVRVILPKIIYEDGLLTNKSCGIEPLLDRLFCIYDAKNVNSSLFHCENENLEKQFVTKINSSKISTTSSTWSFIRMLNLSPKEVEDQVKSFCARLTYLVNFQSVLDKIFYDSTWSDDHSIGVGFPDQILYRFLSQSLNQVLLPLKNIVLVPETIENRRLKRSLCGVGSSTLTSKLKTSVLKVLQPRFLRCCTANVLSQGIIPTIHNFRINERMQFRENRYLLSQQLSSICKELSSEEKYFVSALHESTKLRDESHIKFPDPEYIVTDSGKMMRLDGLLHSFEQSGAHVLICFYLESMQELLEQFLELRRWKYMTVSTSGHSIRSGTEAFIYLLHVPSIQQSISSLTVDTVIFFDQDWCGSLEDQKQVVVNKLNLDRLSKVNFYRLISKGTVEERLMKLNKEKNLVSLLFNKDKLENMNGSSVPSLKSLVAFLLHDSYVQKNSRKRLATGERKMDDTNRDSALCSNNKIFKLNKLKPNENTKDKEYPGAVYDEIDNMLEYVSKNGAGSASVPRALNEGINDGKIDRDMNLIGFDDEDHFNFPVDEGYMGMSPDDSFEALSVKSGYEEDSSPKLYKLGRGSGKRGRPPSRRYFSKRDSGDDNSQMRRGPGRPRLKTVGPRNQGISGRRPGRPPLTKKAETISSGLLAPLSTSQRVFGFYSSPDLELS